MTKRVGWAAILVCLFAIDASTAQRPPGEVSAGPPDVAKFPAARAGASICAQWHQIVRMRNQPRAAAASIPSFQGLELVCGAFQRNTALPLNDKQRSDLIAGLCRDWKGLQAVRANQKALPGLPPLREFAQTCGESGSSNMMKYSCTSGTGSVSTSGCCCLGELDCTLADRIGRCTNDCRGMKEFCERVQKGTFRALAN